MMCKGSGGRLTSSSSDKESDEREESVCPDFNHKDHRDSGIRKTLRESIAEQERRNAEEESMEEEEDSMEEKEEEDPELLERLPHTLELCWSNDRDEIQKDIRNKANEICIRNAHKIQAEGRIQKMLWKNVLRGEMDGRRKMIRYDM
jgi:hypothetical protein